VELIMRYLVPAELLEAVAATLREEVIPDCASRHVIGQLWAAIGILENLATRVEENAAAADAECRALQDWIAGWRPDELADGGGHPAGDFATADNPAAIRDRCRQLLSAGLLPTEAMNDLRRVLTELSEAERSVQRPVNFVAAFES
jgi:hypothetical protein